MTEPRGSDSGIVLFIDTFQPMRGMQSHTAAILAGELGELTRFDNRRLLTASVGLMVL